VTACAMSLYLVLAHQRAGLARRSEEQNFS